MFGERRRQCSSCKKTWRVWQKKRGRKNKRLSINQLFKYLDGKLNVSNTNNSNLRSLVRKFTSETSWISMPDGDLIVIADALIQYFGKQKYTIYFILFRSVCDHKAYIFTPFMRKGCETVVGWHEAFAQIPNDVIERIKALVCDGHGGLIYLAKNRDWKLQRCHFHLLARIGHYASFGRLNRTKNIGKRVKNLANIVLYKNNSVAVSLALAALKELMMKITSRGLKAVISGFLRHYEDFRTYLKFPKYNLPATSNSAEHLVGLVRGLQYRARGFRTPSSLFMWITAICKYKKHVTCRGKIQPN